MTCVRCGQRFAMDGSKICDNCALELRDVEKYEASLAMEEAKTLEAIRMEDELKAESNSVPEPGF